MRAERHSIALVFILRPERCRHQCQDHGDDRVEGSQRTDESYRTHGDRVRQGKIATHIQHPDHQCEGDEPSTGSNAPDRVTRGCRQCD